MSDDNSTKPKAPYLPYTTFRKFIAGFKSGVPSRIDKSLMNGHSGSMQSWLLTALRFFSLIDADGNPLPDLEKLAQSEDEARKKLWAQVFTKAYHPLINGLDLKRATLGELNDRFGKDFAVETVRKCQAFFSAGAEDAGIELSPHIKPKARGTGPRKPRKAKTSVPKLEDGIEENQHTTGKPPAAILFLDKEGTRKVTMHAPATITASELDRIQKWLSFQLIVEDGE